MRKKKGLEKKTDGILCGWVYLIAYMIIRNSNLINKWYKTWKGKKGCIVYSFHIQKKLNLKKPNLIRIHSIYKKRERATCCWDWFQTLAFDYYTMNLLWFLFFIPTYVLQLLISFYSFYIVSLCFRILMIELHQLIDLR